MHQGGDACDLRRRRTCSYGKATRVLRCLFIIHLKRTAVTAVSVMRVAWVSFHEQEATERRARAVVQHPRVRASPGTVLGAVV